jgi:hypothetical protein
LYVGISALKSVCVRRTCSATNVVRRRSVESIAADFLFQNPRQHARMQRLQRIEFGGAFTMPLLERLAALFGLLDRDARQRMVLALLRGENDRADLNVYIVFILLLSPLISVLFLVRLVQGNAAAATATDVQLSRSVCRIADRTTTRQVSVQRSRACGLLTQEARQVCCPLSSDAACLL